MNGQTVVPNLSSTNLEERKYMQLVTHQNIPLRGTPQLNTENPFLPPFHCHDPLQSIPESHLSLFGLSEVICTNDKLSQDGRANMWTTVLKSVLNLHMPRQSLTNL